MNLKKKQTHIGYVYATTEGLHPSAIYKGELPRPVMRVCNIYKPKANWRIYELVKVESKTKTGYKILNQTQAFSIALIQRIFAAHHDRYTESIKLEMRGNIK